MVSTSSKCILGAFWSNVVPGKRWLFGYFYVRRFCSFCSRKCAETHKEERLRKLLSVSFSLIGITRVFSRARRVSTKHTELNSSINLLESLKLNSNIVSFRLKNSEFGPKMV